MAHREANARYAQNRSQGRTGHVGGPRKRVEESGLDSATRDQLLHRVDRAIDDTKKIIEQHRPQIELAERNNEVRQQVEQERKYKVEVQEKFALMVNECNQLMEEQRDEEAQVLAKQANELAPDNPVSTQLLWQTKFVANWARAKSMRDKREEGFVIAMDNAEDAATPFDDMKPYIHGDAKEWEKLSSRRQKYAHDGTRGRSEREIEIEKKLRTPVSLEIRQCPAEQGDGVPGQAGAA